MIEALSLLFNASLPEGADLPHAVHDHLSVTAMSTEEWVAALQTLCADDGTLAAAASTVATAAVVPSTPVRVLRAPTCHLNEVDPGHILFPEHTGSPVMDGTDMDTV